MDCPYCHSNIIKEYKTKTNLGYCQYFCRKCHYQYNEQTGTKFNFIEFPNEVVMLAVYYYYKFKVSLNIDTKKDCFKLCWLSFDETVNKPI